MVSPGGLVLSGWSCLKEEQERTHVCWSIELLPRGAEGLQDTARPLCLVAVRGAQMLFDGKNLFLKHLLQA